MLIDAREVRERLLDLFPAATIQQFPQVREKMTKADGIAAVVQDAEVTDVREFVATMFGYLHQHVHVFTAIQRMTAPMSPCRLEWLLSRRQPKGKSTDFSTWYR